MRYPGVYWGCDANLLCLQRKPMDALGCLTMANHFVQVQIDFWGSTLSLWSDQIPVRAYSHVAVVQSEHHERNVSTARMQMSILWSQQDTFCPLCLYWVFTKSTAMSLRLTHILLQSYYAFKEHYCLLPTCTMFTEIPLRLCQAWYVQWQFYIISNGLSVWTHLWVCVATHTQSNSINTASYPITPVCSFTSWLQPDRIGYFYTSGCSDCKLIFILQLDCF